MLTASLITGVALAIGTLAVIADHLPPARIVDPALWPVGWPHEAPDHPLSAAEAHQTMQRHSGCSRAECPRKAAAYTVLVAAGHIRPDTGRTR